MSNLAEYNDILEKIHENNLQFLGLIDMSKEEAINKIQSLKFNTYNALKASVNYHANKPRLGLNIQATTPKPAAIKPITAPQPKVTTRVFSEPAYGKVLDPESDANEIDPKYLTVRAEYLNALRALENSPGCSNCQRGKLRRKFIEKLTALDNSSSES